jgi:hypothetical protein
MPWVVCAVSDAVVVTVVVDSVVIRLGVLGRGGDEEAKADLPKKLRSGRFF